MAGYHNGNTWVSINEGSLVFSPVITGMFNRLHAKLCTQVYAA